MPGGVDISSLAAYDPGRCPIYGHYAKHLLSIHIPQALPPYQLVLRLLISSVYDYIRHPPLVNCHGFSWWCRRFKGCRRRRSRPVRPSPGRGGDGGRVQQYLQSRPVSLRGMRRRVQPAAAAFGFSIICRTRRFRREKKAGMCRMQIHRLGWVHQGLRSK